jgi:hypothetical protein
MGTYKDEINDTEKQQIETLIADTRQAIATNNKQNIENATKNLTESTQKIFGEAYQRKAAKGGEQPPTEPQQQSGEDVDEADFKDLGDKK